MTVAGCVQFTEVWRVEFETTVPFDVLAESMGGAIALAVAFINRDRTGPSAVRVSPEQVIGVMRSKLDVSLLVPTTVDALNYPDVEVAAQVTDRTKATMVQHPGDYDPTMKCLPRAHPQGCFCTDCMPTRYTNTQQPELPIHDEHAPLPTGPLISRGAIARDQRNDATRGFATRATIDDDGIEK